VIGVYAGEVGSEICFEYLLNGANGSIDVFEVEAPQQLSTPDGFIHYNIQREDPKKFAQRIPLSRDLKEDWLPLLDLLIYCTKANSFRLPGIGPPGVIVPTKTHFTATDEEDDLGRRKFQIVTTTEVSERFIIGQPDSRPQNTAITGSGLPNANAALHR